METSVLQIFQREVERQCRFALIAFEDLDGAFSINPDPVTWTADEKDRFWYSLQAFLVAAANVSKLLWPAREQLPKRGQVLRASLSVEEDSPLRSRDLRNHFEHFDERLDVWVKSSKRRVCADSYIGEYGIPGLDKEDYHRNFNTRYSAITFYGEFYELRPIVDAISDLWIRAAAEAEKAH